jgi:hypothetical protein
MGLKSSRERSHHPVHRRLGQGRQTNPEQMEPSDAPRPRTPIRSPPLPGIGAAKFARMTSLSRSPWEGQISVRVIASFTLMFLGLRVSVAFAQQFAQTASRACNAITRGTVNCPTYTAPATTGVPRAPMDGSVFISSGGVSTPLFNGAVPPNGFLVEGPGTSGNCWVNDNGPANIPVGPGNFGQAGFTLITAGGYSFATPQGYKPMGVVSVICTTPAYIAARGW